MPDVDDLWFREVDGELIPTLRHGRGRRWQARWRDPAGVQRKRSFTKKTGPGGADSFLAETLHKMAAGSYIDPAAGRITFAEYAETWRLSRTHDRATADRIERSFRNHVYDGQTAGRAPKGGPALGGHQIGALSRSPSLIQAWIKGLPLAASTARILIKDVSQVFTAAVEDGRIVRNPLQARSIQRPRPEIREAVAWTASQVSAVAAKLPGQLAALPELGASCGARQGELLALAVEDVDFLRKTVRVSVQVKYLNGRLFFAPVKNKKTRDVPLADPVLPVLAEHLRRHPAREVSLPWLRPDGTEGRPVTRRLVFTRPDGSAYKRSTINNMWRNAVKDVNLPDGDRVNGCHALRHTAASVWLSGGLGIPKVAAYLGDTKEIVLATYGHFMPDDDGRARGIMNAFFDPAPDVPSSGSCAENVPTGTLD